MATPRESHLTHGDPQRRRKLEAVRGLLRDVWTRDYIPRERNDIVALGCAVQKRMRQTNLSYVRSSHVRYETDVQQLTEGKAKDFVSRATAANTQAHVREVMSSVNPLCIRLAPPSSPLHIPPEIKDMVEIDSTCVFANSLLALLYGLKKPFYVNSTSMGLCSVKSLQMVSGVYMGPIRNALAYYQREERVENTWCVVAEAVGCDETGRRAYGHIWARLEIKTSAGDHQVAFMDCTATQFGRCSSANGVEFWLEGAAKGEPYKLPGSVTLVDLKRPLSERVLNPLVAFDQHLLVQAIEPLLEGRSVAEDEGWILPRGSVEHILQALDF